MKVVIDTNVLVSALKSTQGASYELISLLPSIYFQPALSVPLYSEYQDVLTREYILKNITNDDILGFLRYVCHISHRQEIFFLWRPWLKDPKDDMVLELAVASNCKYIITHNLNDFNNIDKFAIEAIIPAQFLEILEELTNG
jgi:putative PIN family toxin of toxin-antitoxin system